MILSLYISIYICIHISYNCKEFATTAIPCQGRLLTARIARNFQSAPWSKGWSLPRNEALEGFWPRGGKYKDLAYSIGAATEATKKSTSESGVVSDGN